MKLLRLFIPEEGYNQLLTHALKVSGFSADTPLMPNRGVSFIVSLEPADIDADVRFVRGVLLPESMKEDGHGLDA